MERIRDAISKAREMRENVATEIGVAEIKQEHTRTAIDPSVSEISYDTTRVQSLDPQVLEQNRIVTALEQDPRAEIYRQLRSQIIPRMQSESWQTLAITSPGENAGKTLTAVNLAIAIAREHNHTVLLVDLDLHSPSVDTTLGLDVEYGISDCLLNDVPIQEVLINPQIHRLVVLPGRGLNKYSSELLTSPKTGEIMSEIINRYKKRLIIFDLPPLLRNDDALIFTPKVDATLLVLEDGASNEEDINRCLHLLKDSNHIGTILNKAVV